MKTLVTGAGGFLGLYIVEQLLARGDPVPKWKDTWIPRIGIEYYPVPIIALRGGYFYELSPIPDQVGVHITAVGIVTINDIVSAVSADDVVGPEAEHVVFVLGAVKRVVASSAVNFRHGLRGPCIDAARIGAHGWNLLLRS